MLQRLVAALSSKAAIAVAAGSLAVGAAATAGPALVSDSRPAADSTGLLESSTTAERTAAAHEEGTEVDIEGEPGPPTDTFGAEVSADARDGGVDGGEISDRARARNHARRAARCHDDEHQNGTAEHDNEAWHDDGGKQCADDDEPVGAGAGSEDTEQTGHGRGGGDPEHDRGARGADGRAADDRRADDRPEHDRPEDDEDDDIGDDED